MNADKIAERLNQAGISLRHPTAEDGMAIHQLIANCPPLDTNSAYCNLLQSSHFAQTAVIAEKDGKVVGSVTGYIPPQEPDTFFLWQVAADSSARGTGLGTAMIHFILTSEACKSVQFLNTTITEDNEASWGLFKGIAKKLGAELNSEVMFDKKRHFKGEHDSEMLVRIGPFSLN